MARKQLGRGKDTRPGRPWEALPAAPRRGGQGSAKACCGERRAVSEGRGPRRLPAPSDVPGTVASCTAARPTTPYLGSGAEGGGGGLLHSWPRESPVNAPQLACGWVADRGGEEAPKEWVLNKGCGAPGAVPPGGRQGRPLLWASVSGGSEWNEVGAGRGRSAAGSAQADILSGPKQEAPEEAGWHSATGTPERGAGHPSEGAGSPAGPGVVGASAVLKLKVLQAGKPAQGPGDWRASCSWLQGTEEWRSWEVGWGLGCTCRSRRTG